MADYFPLIVNSVNATINELPAGDNLTLANSNIVNAGNISANFFIGDGSQLANLPIGTTLSNGNSSVSIPQANGNIILNVAGSTVATVTNSSIEVTGNITPSPTNTYSLGNSTHRWNDLYLSGNTIFLGDSIISTDANTLTLTNGNGGSFEVGGNSTVTTIQNGNSNISVSVNGNIVTSVAGNANIMVVTGTGVNVAGTLNVSGNANVGNIGATRGVFTNVSGNGSALSSITGANVSGTVANATFATSAGSATTADTVSTAAQPNITSVGTLTGLGVNGNITAANITANTGVFTGNGSGLSAITGANVTGTVPSANNATTAGTVTTASQPNITSVGTLSNLSVGGNAVISGNLTVDGNLVYVNVDTLAVEDPIIELQSGPNGVAPTSNSGKDIGTALNYYDTQARVAFMGWDVSNSEFGLASVATISNEVVTFGTYGNLRVGNIIGNGQSLTGLSGANVIGQVGNALVAGTVYTAAQPNITSVGTLTVLNVSGNANAGNIGATNGVFTSVSGNGSALTALNANNISTGTLAQARLANSNVILGNTALTLGTTTNTIAGLSSVTSTTFVGSLTGAATTAGTVTTAAQPNITSVGTLTGLGVNGNITAANITANTGVFTGNGSGLSAIAGANITGEVAFAATANAVAGANVSGAVAFATTANAVAGANVSGQVANALIAGTVYTAAQPNITSLGTLTSLAITGNATAGNISTAGSLSVTGNANVGNISAADAVFTTVSGNGSGLSAITGANVTGEVAFAAIANSVAGANVTGTVPSANNATTAGTVTTAAQPNITSVGTLTSLDVTGNANVGNIGATNGVFTNVSGNGSALSSITGANVTGEVSFAATANTVAGANVSGQVANALVASTVFTAAQPNITSVGTLTSLTISGNANAGNIGANNGVFTSVSGNGSALTALNGSNITTGTIAAARVATLNQNTTGSAATVTTAAQPNITSVGTLTGLGVNGNITAANITANTGVFTGNGSGLSAIVGANVSGAVAFATTANSVAGANVNGTVSSATTAGTVTTAAQPNITSVGTLTSLTVTGNANAGNVGATNFVGSGASLTSLNGSNITTGTIAAARVATLNQNTTGSAATVTTAAQPNITSVGTLSSLNVTGNASVGNIGAVNAVFTGTGAFGGNVAMGNFNITGLADPINQQDAATKVYVDEVAQGLKTRTAADAYSASNLSATYDNGTAGVGATLTATANGAFPTIDGVTLNTTTARRLLVAGQTNTAHNGLYVLIQQGNGSTPWILRRCVECDTSQEIPGSYVFINSGNVYANTGWVASVVNPATFVVGTDAINWIQFSGAGTFTAGTGLTLTGTVFSVNASQTQVTSVGTLTGLNVNGTVTASAFTANTGVFTGNGAALTNLNASNVSSGTLAQARLANANVTLGNTILTLGSTVTTVAGLTSVTSTTFVGSLTGAATTAGTVTTAAQPNITSVGALTSLSVTGNANVGNIGATNFVGSGASLTNLNASNLASGTVPSARLSGTYTITVSGSATTAGTVTTAAQPNITSVGTLTSLSVTGNANVGNIGANNGVFTSVSGNGSALAALNGSNITTGTIAAARVATLNQNTTGSAATVTTAAQPNITSVGTLTSLTVSGNANVGSIGATNGVFTSVSGNGSALTALNGSNITTGTVAAARVAILNQNTTGSAATVTTAAQPNITSVGTLTSATVSGTANLSTTSGYVAVGGTGQFNSFKYSQTGGALGNSVGNQILHATYYSTDSNADYLEITNTRYANGTDWVTAGSRLQQKVDATWMGFIQFNGAVSGGITFGTGTTTANPTSIPGRIAMDGSGHFYPITDNSLTLGTVSNRWSTVHATTVRTTALTTGANTTAGTVTGNWTLTAGSRWQSTYADLAERYVADTAYEPGTVVVLGGENEVTIENVADSHKVAGVVTTNPAYIMNAELQGDDVVEVALIGRVPCKVVGPVSKGDLLTSAEIAGYAHANNNATAGRIVGKSLENFDGETGVIEIMVGKT